MIHALGLAALCAAWLLPGHYFPWTTFQQDTLALSGMALIALGATVTSGLRRFAVPRFALVTFALAGVPLLQWAGGMIPFFGDALLCALFLAAFSMAVVAAATLTQAHGDGLLNGLIAAIAVAAFVSTGIGIVQWLRLGDFSQIESLGEGGRIFANLTQPNNFASLLALGVAGLLWLYESRRIGGPVAASSVCFLGFGLVMTQSRTGWGFVLFLALWALLMRRRAALRTSAPAVAGGVAFFVAATALWQPLNSLLDLGIAIPTADRASQFGTRGIHWMTMLDALSKSPWFGWGWYQVTVAQQAVVLDHPAPHEWITFSHNGLLDLLVWNGVPIGLALCVGLGWWIMSRVRRCRDARMWCLFAALGALLIHALLEYPLAYAFFLVPAGLMIGIVEARLAAPTGEAPGIHLPRAAYAVMLAALLGMLSWVWLEYVDIEDAARRVRLKEAGYVANDEQPTVPDVVLLDNQREYLRFWMSTAHPGMTPEELDWMRTLSQRFAAPGAMLRYALAAGMNGREQDATRTLRLLCHMYSVRSCNETRSTWDSARQRYPQLRGIEFPEATPVVARH